MPASLPSWYVLHTKPRQELRAQDNLEAWGLETLLPQLPDRRRHKTGPAPFYPLFPSYLFCRFAPMLFDKVRYTYGVSYILSFGGVPAVVDDDIITTMQERMDPAGVIKPFQQLRPGAQVVIQSGPFRDLVGVFEREMPGTERIRVLLNTVTIRARVELARGDVLPLIPGGST